MSFNLFLCFLSAVAGVASSCSLSKRRQSRMHQGSHRQLMSLRPTPQLPRCLGATPGFHWHGEWGSSTTSPLSVKTKQGNITFCMGSVVVIATVVSRLSSVCKVGGKHSTPCRERTLESGITALEMELTRDNNYTLK